MSSSSTSNAPENVHRNQGDDTNNINQFQKAQDIKVQSKPLETLEEIVQDESTKGLNLLSDPEQASGQINDQMGVMKNQGQLVDHATADHLNWPEKPFTDGGLSNTSFQAQEGINDLEQAIQHGREALELTPKGHPDRPSQLNDLAVSLGMHFEDLGQIDDLEQAILYGREALDLTPMEHPDRPGLLSNLAVSLESYFNHSGQMDHLAQGIQCRREALAVTPKEHPDRPDRLSYFASLLWTHFQKSGQIDDLKQAILYGREALELTPMGHPERLFQLNNLALSLQMQFDNLGEIDALEEVILYRKEALELTPIGHPDRLIDLNKFVNLLQKHFELVGQMNDLEQAILYRKEALKLIPMGHANWPIQLYSLTVLLWKLFEHSGKIDDLKQAILYGREAIELTPMRYPDRTIWLKNFAGILQKHFELSGQIDDLEQAILYKQEVLELTPIGHPDRLIQLNNIAVLLQEHFKHLGHIEDLEQAILHSKEALQYTPKGYQDRPTQLNNFAGSFQKRFEHLGQIDDIKQAILYGREALELASMEHPNRPNLLRNLSVSLESHFNHLGLVDDLEQAILYIKEALELTQMGDPDRSMQLNNLAVLLQKRFKHLGQIDDLEQAISFARKALKPTPTEHSDRAIRLNNFAILLRKHFEHLGQIDDLEQAIIHEREALELTPIGHPDRPLRLNHFAVLLGMNYGQLRQIDNLKQAILYGREALELTPMEHPDRYIQLHSFASLLQMHFEHSEKIEDLQQAIHYGREALELTPVGHSNRPFQLNNLALILQMDFKNLGEIGSLEEAIQCIREALELTPVEHLNRPTLLNNLATSLWVRYQNLGQKDDLHQFDKSLIEASGLEFPQNSTAAPFASFKAAYCLAWRAAVINNNDLSFAASKQAMRLLSKVIWSGSPIHDQYSRLLKITGVARLAASVAIRTDDYDTALEWLEQGRSIVWSHILQLHTPFDDLKHVQPDLASRLSQVGKKLTITRKIIDSDLRSLEKNSNGTHQRHHELALEWDKLVTKVRQVPGFERFLLPKEISELKGVAHAGPVIVLNASSIQCDALILHSPSSKIIHVPLSRISYKDAQQLQAQIQKILHQQGLERSNSSTEAQTQTQDENRSGRDIDHPWIRLLQDLDMEQYSESKFDSHRHLGHGKRPKSSEEEMQLVLSTLWDKVVQPIINALSLKALSSTPLPHIFWCPTGPFMSLPIHAAGVYTGDSLELRLSSFCVSSYTPTIGALLPATRTMDEEVKILAVGVSKAPKYRRLPNVLAEVGHIQKQANNMGIHLTKYLEPTVADIKQAISNHNWIHFACHGIQNTTTPLSSGLILSDGMLKLSDIIHLTGPPKGLAFLSACQTAKGKQDLQDESIHVAAGMQLAGYKSVIATMWSIEDAYASEVAANVYEELFKTKTPDHTQSAVALHQAVENLKKRHAKLSLLTWVPFVHIGH